MTKLFLTLATLALISQTGSALAQANPDYIPDPAFFAQAGVKMRHYNLPTKRGFKKGSAVCKSYLGVVKTGDCGIGDAIKNGNIDTLRYVDYKNSKIFLSLFRHINSPSYC